MVSDGLGNDERLYHGGCARRGKESRSGGVACILGESEQGILIVTEVLGKRESVKDLGHLIHYEGNQFAGLLITFKRQPIVAEVANLEA